MSSKVHSGQPHPTCLGGEEEHRGGLVWNEWPSLEAAHIISTHLVKWLHSMIKRARDGEKMIKQKKNGRMDLGG